MCATMFFAHKAVRQTAKQKQGCKVNCKKKQQYNVFYIVRELKHSNLQFIVYTLYSLQFFPIGKTLQCIVCLAFLPIGSLRWILCYLRYTLVCFTVCLTALFVYSFVCKTLQHTQGRIDSILPISLQQIAYKKIYAVHSNELAEGYTLIPVTIFIDKYWGGDILKLVDFSRISGILIIF